MKELEEDAQRCKKR